MAVAPRHALAGAELGARFTDVHRRRTGDRFELLEARDRRTGRLVVIKVAHESSAAWQHEVVAAQGRILAALGSHPHIITCYEQLELPDGRPALVLERCPNTLYDALHGVDAMQLREVVAIGVKLAGALETVHRSGVLHCDVRPRTALVTEAGEPVLAGFDEAVRVDAAADRPPLHHLTPHTAPELLEGGTPTAATDVYGLASTIYELVAGRAAFRAHVGESPASVIVRVLSSPVLPIVAPNVPLEISDLLTWAMSPQQADRPPSPSWLAEELGRVEQRQGWPRTRMIVR
ncbi:MAG: serine/threonine-protein kinase PknK [Pseudonocardiales bacterium]|nr:serine/threonine-protein kinase PknK [Pseudonocardiales bacterium]